MESKINQEIVQSPINARWRRDRVCFSSFVRPEEAMGFEMEHFFPYYVFVEKGKVDNIESAMTSWTCKHVPSGRITFFDQNDKPIFPDGSDTAKWKWFQLDPWELGALGLHLDERLPEETTIDGKQGWIIPLYESETLTEMDDINVYLHNLMRWESMLVPQESGPIMQRFAWIMQRMYELTIEKERAERKSEAKEMNKDWVEKRLEAIEQRKQLYGERITKEQDECHDDN